MSIKIINRALAVAGISCCVVSLIFPSFVYQCYSFMTAGSYFPTDRLELGYIPVGGKTQFHIKFINNHASLLHVAKVATSCGCTVAQASVNSVRPFGSAEITGYIKPYNDGKSMKEVVLFTDKGVSRIYLTYTAVNPDIIAASPTPSTSKIKPML